MKRREFVQTLTLATAAGTCRAETKTKKPNVVFFLIDDMGWKDFGEAGSTYYETPHIDQLSREGIRFTKGYSSAPVRAPQPHPSLVWIPWNT